MLYVAADWDHSSCDNCSNSLGRGGFFRGRCCKKKTRNVKVKKKEMNDTCTMLMSPGLLPLIEL